MENQKQCPSTFLRKGGGQKKQKQKELCIHKDLIMATCPCKSNRRKKNQYLAHMTKTLVICKKYTYYKIKFAHYYL